ncbi:MULTISPECIES: hypothetical protein [Mycolicibacter]|uniref:hypothetical protein n=1 Tax=Mycolicibacter TaxID=1073531 RepID=UPI003305767B
MLAAYGGVFVAGSPAWGRAPRWVAARPLGCDWRPVCLVGVAVIVYAMRPLTFGRNRPS